MVSQAGGTLVFERSALDSHDTPLNPPINLFIHKPGASYSHSELPESALVAISSLPVQTPLTGAMLNITHNCPPAGRK